MLPAIQLEIYHFFSVSGLEKLSNTYPKQKLFTQRVTQSHKFLVSKGSLGVSSEMSLPLRPVNSQDIGVGHILFLEERRDLPKDFVAPSCLKHTQPKDRCLLDSGAPGHPVLVIQVQRRYSLKHEDTIVFVIVKPPSSSTLHTLTSTPAYNPWPRLEGLQKQPYHLTWSTSPLQAGILPNLHCTITHYSGPLL